MNMMIVVVYSFIIGGCGAFLFYKYGGGCFIDIPEERSSHSKAVAKGGGAGLIVAFFVTAVQVNADPVFLFSAVAVSIMGLIGDCTELSPLFRLSVQCLLSFLVTLSLVDFQIDTMAGWSIVLFWSFFIAATANFFNFMDGIDGIAALVGIIAFFLICLFLFIKGSFDNFAMIAVAVLFACLGFLPFNFPVAKVFMGDIGSLLLGFLFAGFVCKYSTSSYDFFLMVSFLLPFYADVISTMALRVQKKENLLKPHRRHLYQILVNELCVPHWKVSLTYAVLQASIGLLLIPVYFCIPEMLMPIISVLFLMLTVISAFVRKKTI